VLEFASFGVLLAGAAFVCFLGILLGHRAWWRSKGRLSARLLSVAGLLFGYATALIIGSMALALEASAPVVAKNEAVPDARPKVTELAKLEPQELKPTGGEIAKIEPAAKPAGVEIAKLEPAKAEPAKSEPPAPAAMASTAGAGEADPVQFFEAKIHPILSDKCFKCHSEQAGKSKGGLTLDTRDALLKGGDTGPGIEPGKPESSLMIKAVLYTNDDLQMPPKGEKLSDKEIADLTAWVKMGAPYTAKAK
jgi:mono/diheme cytochrome c family protein